MTCAECGQEAQQSDLVFIPEPDGCYVLCIACYEGIEDEWDKLQAIESQPKGRLPCKQ